jgi:hypothetical protein
MLGTINNLQVPRGMSFHGMLRHMALERTEILEERIASIIRVTRIGELGTSVPPPPCSVLWLLVTDNIVLISLTLLTLMIEAMHSSKNASSYKSCMA